MGTSRLTQSAINQGLEPRVSTIETPTLHNAFYGAALHVLNKGAPGIAPVMREALARNIALRCDRAVAVISKSQEAA